jgi:hypothetical protein
VTQQTAATLANQLTGETTPPPASIAEPSELQRLLQRDAFSTRDLLTGDALDKVMRLAEVMASGRATCPKHLQGNVGDCAAVIGQAMRWGMDHNAVAQKTHLVNGVLGYEAQLIIAVLNSSRALATRLDFEWFGSWAGVNGKTDKSHERGVRVWATMAGETKPRLIEVTMAQVGDVRNSPNWAADPRQQLAYLAAKRWGRLHAPDVILGVYTPDELDDIQPSSAALPRNATPTQIASAALPKVERTDAHSSLIAKLEQVAKAQGFEPFKSAWAALPKEDRAAIGTTERDRIAAIGKALDEQCAAAADAAAASEDQEPGSNG